MNRYTPVPRVDYEVGDQIVYETMDGQKRLITVTEKTDNVRWGHPGFHGLNADGDQQWGYDVQVEHVQTRAADAMLAGVNEAHERRMHEMGDRQRAREWAHLGCTGCQRRITMSRW